MHVFKNPRCLPLASKKFKKYYISIWKATVEGHTLALTGHLAVRGASVFQDFRGRKRHQEIWAGETARGGVGRVQKHISHFARTPFSAKKSLESMSFLVLPQHEQFYPEGLSVFAPLGTWESGLDKVSTEIQGLFSITHCNCQGLSKHWIFTLTFKNFQINWQLQRITIMHISSYLPPTLFL